MSDARLLIIGGGLAGRSAGGYARATPVVYFVATSALLHASWLGAATVLFALTHVPSSQREARGWQRGDRDRR
jgi:hypothetical protein